MVKLADINVIIVALAGGRGLESCLQALSEVWTQCVVVLGRAMGDTQQWQRRFPGVVFIDGGSLPVPLKRLRAIERVTGDIVALLEDTSIPCEGWIQSVRAAFDDEATVAVGGPVLISPSLPGRYKALGCGEYGLFHPRRFEQSDDLQNRERDITDISRLPGNNLAYRRSVLANVLSDVNRGLLESEVNQNLLNSGRHLTFHPGMAVMYAVPDQYGALLKTRLMHGRLFAGNRIKGRGWVTRLTWCLKSLLLPAVLSGRALNSMRYAVNPSSWLPVACWICLLESAWALGEMAGYACGEGRSLEAWR